MKQNLTLLTICVALTIITGIILSHTYLLRHNTLANNGKWISSKVALETVVMGAKSFIRERQALAQERLNLASWHGFQEVLYKDRLPVARLEFDFNLGPKAYLNLIVDNSDSGASGFRFSSFRYFDNIRFEAKRTGEFLTKEKFGELLKADRWYHATIQLSEQILIFLDNEEIAQFQNNLPETVRIGFKGGLRKALVDNIEIHLTSGESVDEAFRNQQDFWRVTILFITISVGLTTLGAILLYSATKTRGRNLFFSLITINLILIVIATGGYTFVYYKKPLYPSRGALKPGEEGWKKVVTKHTVRQIREKHPETVPANINRILFLGTSQTWGAGASVRTKSFTGLLEQALNRHCRSEMKFECINAGIPGVNSSVIVKLFEEEWLKLTPTIVVINLGTNDTNRDIFAQNLNNMIRMCKKAKVAPLLVLEPNAPENNNSFLLSKHAIMRQVSREHGIPVVDIHAYLRDRYDDGFLWWDFVHLSDFGHELFSGKLSREIRQLVRCERYRD